MIDEGILTKGIVRNEDNSVEEVVYISFERFDDHLTVNYLLNGVDNIEDEFKTGGSLQNTSMMNTVFIAIKESLRLYLFNHQKNMEKKFMNYCLITVTIII